jgi:hypothetical protein
VCDHQNREATIHRSINGQTPKENSEMTKYEGKTLSKAIFVVEECCIINCTLIDCDFFYSGGDFELVNVRFENCRWHFRSQALKTIQLQQMIGMLPNVQLPPPPMGDSAKAPN